MPEIPSGTVTFIFTDIEGSTNMWEHSSEQMQRNFPRQESLLRETFAACGGYVYKMIGDAFQVAFATAPEALKAAIEAQRRLYAETWDGAPIRVRMALHTGVTEERGNDYVGPVLNRVARLLSAGHGGQILLTQATYELVRDNLPPAVQAADVGSHRLKDLIRPEHVYQVIVPGLPAAFPPLKTLDTFPHNLPIQLTSFVGREKEMAEVKRLFMDAPGTVRLVTLTGPGGTGKTRLSLHVAADLLESFPNGVWFIELAALADPSLVPQTIASALGLSVEIGRPILPALIDHLRKKRLLLILDNCEHMIQACAQTADALLRSCPALCILASSRELLGIGGELPYRVPSLSTPDTHNLPPVEALPQFDAVRLFIERATTAAPSFSVSNANAPAIAEICHRLDGIPLAIELVAARVAMLSVEQIAVRLDNSFRLLTGGSRTAMPRHQTLRALIDWSYDTLPRAEQVLLQRLSVFRGGWTLEAAEEVCVDRITGAVCADPMVGDYPHFGSGDILDLLAQLVNKSLVQVERSTGPARYRLLETIRQYAREKLANEKLANEKLAGEKSAGETAAGDRQASSEGNTRENVIRGQHRAYYLALAGQPEEVLRGPDQAAWIDRLEEDVDNIRAALDYSLGSDIEAGLQAAAALLWFWHIRGYGREGLEWLERLLTAEAVQRHGSAQGIPANRAVARARALNAAGFLRCSYDEDSTGAVLLEESLNLLKSTSGDVRNETARAYLNLGRFAADARDYARARGLFEQALALYRSSASRFGIAESLNELGVIETIEGSREKAARLLGECLTLRRQIGDQDGIAFNLASLSEFAFLQGDLPRARQLITESLEIFKQSRNRIFMVMSLNFLGLITWLMGDFEAAARLYESFIAEGADQGAAPVYYNRTGDLLNCKGNIALSQGQYDAAARFFTQALTFGQQHDHPGIISMALLGLGRIARDLGQLPQARQHLQEALKASQKYESKGQSALIYCALARVSLAQGDEPGAVEAIRQAIPLFHMPFFRWAVVIGLEGLIILATRRQQYERAALIFGAAEKMSTLTLRHLSRAERAELARSIQSIQAALGEPAFHQEVVKGQGMSLEQAAEYALSN